MRLQITVRLQRLFLGGGFQFCHSDHPTTQRDCCILDRYLLEVPDGLWRGLVAANLMASARLRGLVNSRGQIKQMTRFSRLAPGGGGALVAQQYANILMEWADRLRAVKNMVFTGMDALMIIGGQWQSTLRSYHSERKIWFDKGACQYKNFTMAQIEEFYSIRYIPDKQPSIKTHIFVGLMILVGWRCILDELSSTKTHIFVVGLTILVGWKEIGMGRINQKAGMSYLRTKTNKRASLSSSWI